MTTSRLLRPLILLAALVSVGVLVFSLGRPLIDQHGFRQTQTAISVWWMLHGGRWWDYETPVLGAGWSVPFEFPLYQWIVAAVVRVLHLPLDAAGRIVSWLWLIACVPAVRALTRSYALPPLTTPAFAILLLASPVYLFWGRAFLMETQAVALGFWTLAGFAAFLRRRSLPALLLATLAGLCLCLTKITTALPFLALAFAMMLAQLLAERERTARMPATIAGSALVGLVGPVLFELWTKHADAIKAANPLTADYASTTPLMTAWNFGTLGQRLGGKMVATLFRSIVDVGGWAAPLILIALVLWYGRTAPAERRRTGIVIVLLIGGWLLPYLVFANLEIQHNYYQAGNAALLIAALAVAIGAIAVQARPALLMILMTAVLLSQYARFATSFLPSMRNSPIEREYVVGEALKAQTPPGSVVVVTGLDWSSVAPYYAERRAIMTVPTHAHAILRTLFTTPTAFSGGLPVSAIARCPSVFEQDTELAALLDRLTAGRPRQDVAGCQVTLLGAR